MSLKFRRSTEIRSALLHLSQIISQNVQEDEEKHEEKQALKALSTMAASLSEAYGEDFTRLEEGDSYGEIEYLRWALDGCQTLLGFDDDKEMEEAIKTV